MYCCRYISGAHSATADGTLTPPDELNLKSTGLRILSSRSQFRSRPHHLFILVSRYYLLSSTSSYSYYFSSVTSRLSTTSTLPTTTRSSSTLVQFQSVRINEEL